MADKSFLDWPFFEPQHRAFACELENWANTKLGAVDHADTDASCQILVGELGDAGWLQHTGGDLDLRTLCLARETLARHD